MRIEIDLDLCQGHSVCMEEAPEVFSVQENAEGYPFVVVNEQALTHELLDKVKAAAKYCPNSVITIREN